MVIENLVPHIFVDNIITEVDRNYILSYINDYNSINKVLGGTKVIKKDNIQDEKILSILDGIINLFDNNIFEYFSEHISSKVREIEMRTSQIIANFRTAVYGPFISISEPGHFINAHRDDFFQFIICIIYLGHLDNTPAQTTSILNGKEILSLYSEDEISHDRNYENIKRVNFGYSNNSALFFLNNHYAYHMVDKPIEKSRVTIMFSIEIMIDEN